MFLRTNRPTERVRGITRTAPRWIIFRAARCGSDETVNEGSRAAQAGLAGEPAGFFTGPDTDALADPFRRNGCHCNADGLKAIIERLAPLIDRVAPRTSQPGLSGDDVSA